MKTLNFTPRPRSLQVIISILALVLTAFCSTAQLTITVGGQVSGTSIQQGANLQWQITGLLAASQVTNQLWIDKDENNLINPGTDILFVEFTQTDGIPGTESPGDDDASANGIINTNLPGFYFPPGKYIFKTTQGANTAQALYTETVLQNITYTIGGRVTQNENGVPNISIQSRKTSGSGEYYAITNASGYYTINTDIPLTTAIEINVAGEPFNLGVMTGLTASPNKINTTLNGNITNGNFTVASTPLALNFQQITATVQQEKIKLVWHVLDESAIDQYTIERAADGLLFTAVGVQLQQSKGNYSFYDNCPLEGKNYYRIKCVAKDGTITLSNVVVIDFNAKTNGLLVYPNPAKSGTITIERLQPLMAEAFTIYAMEGKIVQQGYITNIRYPLNISNLQPGAYLIKVGNRKATLFIKQ